MMLNKLPGYVRASAGWEWTIFKSLPSALVGGLAAIGLVDAVLHSYPPAGSVAQVEKWLAGVDILAIAVAILHVTIIGTVAIGCIVVLLMKGPAYVADGYDLVDADSPADTGEAGSRRA
jgi:chaperone required for assembly of F1-ATPase